MAKFDHTINLSKTFINNQLTILPITRGDYVIAHFDAYIFNAKNLAIFVYFPLFLPLIYGYICISYPFKQCYGTRENGMPKGIKCDLFIVEKTMIISDYNW
jgi:hypothetical protein